MSITTNIGTTTRASRSPNPPTAHGRNSSIRTTASVPRASGLQRCVMAPTMRSSRLRRLSDGEYRWFLGRAVPHRDPDGNIVNWFGTCTDIQEQKLTQDALRAARDVLSRENIQKDEFLGMVSHELRTPLNAVFGWTRLMQENVLGEEERAQAVDSIMRNAEAQARLSRMCWISRGL